MEKMQPHGPPLGLVQDGTETFGCEWGVCVHDCLDSMRNDASCHRSHDTVAVSLPAPQGDWPCLLSQDCHQAILAWAVANQLTDAGTFGVINKTALTHGVSLRVCICKCVCIHTHTHISNKGFIRS